MSEQSTLAWSMTELDRVCERVIQTRDPRDKPNERFRYIDIASVDRATKRITAPQELKGLDAPSRARQIVRRGDVLVSTTRPNLNAVAIVPDELHGEICSTGFCVLRPTEQIESDFLFAYVQSSEFVASLSDLVKGALYPAVTDKQVRSQVVPLSPIQEQRRIAGVLRDQLAAVERARVAAEAQLDAARALPAAYLREVFSNANLARWRTLEFGRVCRIIAKQVDPKLPEYRDLPHVNGENIESGTCRLLWLNSAAQEGMTSGKYLFEKGCVLYSKLRPYLRKVVLAPCRGVCSADMYPIEIDPSQLDPEYTAWMLLSDAFTNYADEESRRARMPKLNREQLFGWQAPIPKLDEQRELIAKHRNSVVAAGKIHSTLAKQLCEINAIPTALLRAAFQGRI